MTRLDDPDVTDTYGTLYWNFEDKYYFWEVVEMGRKLLQTSFVVLVSIALPAFDVIFGCFAAGAFLVLHCMAKPFERNQDNRLQLAVLTNQWVVMFFLLIQGTKYGPASETWTGILLISIQIALCVYSVSIVAKSLVQDVITQGDSEVKWSTALRLFLKRSRQRLRTVTASVRGRHGGEQWNAPEEDFELTSSRPRSSTAGNNPSKRHVVGSAGVEASV